MSDTEVPSGTFGDYSETNSDASTYPSFYEICDRSGFRVRPGELVEEWTGLWVRPKDLDPRHPQEFVRGIPEKASEQVSPESGDEFINVTGFDLATENGELLSLEGVDGYLRTETSDPTTASDL